MKKIIATATYRNGGFGKNHVSIVRDGGHYVTRMHSHDGCVYRTAREAKDAFRSWIAGQSEVSVTFRDWASA